MPSRSEVDSPPFPRLRPARGSFVRRACSIAIAASCFSAPGLAVAEPHHGIQAGLDVGFHSFRDDVLVPLAFSGFTFGLGPRYYGAFGPGLFAADASLTLAYVLDREGVQGMGLSWSAHTSYLFTVHEKRWRIALGPALGWDNDLLVFSDWDDAHEHWIGTIWVGPGVRAWRSLRGGWRMDLAGDLGLVGFQSRSPTGRRPKQETSADPSLPLTDPTRVLRGSVEFYATRSRAITPNGWGIAGEMALQHASDPETAFAFTTLIRGSYTWGL